MFYWSAFILHHPCSINSRVLNWTPWWGRAPPTEAEPALARAGTSRYDARSCSGGGYDTSGGTRGCPGARHLHHLLPPRLVRLQHLPRPRRRGHVALPRARRPLPSHALTHHGHGEVLAPKGVVASGQGVLLCTHPLPKHTRLTQRIPFQLQAPGEHMQAEGPPLCTLRSSIVRVQ